jgi:hypothetical protein
MKKVNFKKITLGTLILLIILIILGVLSFRPIINPKENDCSKIKGTLAKYRYLTDSRDIQLKINESDQVYYLNHVYDEEINLSDLDSLINRKIVIYSVNHWTLLDPKGKYKHVAKITNEDESYVVYTEF